MQSVDTERSEPTARSDRRNDKRSPSELAAADPAESFSFPALYDSYFDYVVESLRRLGVQGRDLEDVAQEVFLSLDGRLDALDPSRSVRAWVFGFARRHASNYRQLARHYRERVGVEERTLATPKDDPEASTQRNEQVAWVHDALAEMPEELRVTLIMVDLDGFTAQEAADVLGLPLGTVYSRVRRSREVFRQLVHRGGRS